MKGKLLLTDIQSPVEGMQIVCENCTPKIDFIEWIYTQIAEPKLVGYCRLKNMILAPVPLSELKQIVVEYEQEQRSADDFDLTVYTSKKTLLLHPDDWKYALEHIGEEVEFEIIKGTNVYIKKAAERAHSILNQLYDTAKLIHPAPVTYTEEEAQAIARRAMFAGKTHEKIPVKFDVWWNEHKKK